jgi:hypothetical protein
MALVTLIRVNEQAAPGLSIGYILEKLRGNNTFFMVQDIAPTSFGGYTITGPSVKVADYYELPVTAETAGANVAIGAAVLITSIATDPERGYYQGVFADLAALQTAHPTGIAGDTATVTSPNGNIFYWDVAAWVDSGTGYIGDMLQAVYDPTAKSADAFNMANMTESAVAKILTQAERDKLASLPTTQQINDTSGHGLYLDDRVTAATGQDFDDGVTQDIECNGLLFTSERLPTGAASFWNTTTNSIVLDQLEGEYGLGVNFIAEAASRDKLLYVAWVAKDYPIPGQDYIIERRSTRLSKADNTPTDVGMYFAIPAGPMMIGHDIKIALFFEGTDAEVHNVQVRIMKLNAPILP